MEILKFKTSIQSEEDLKKVTSLLDKEEMVNLWKLDTSTSDNILNVSSNDPDPQKIINLIKKAGYDADFIQVYGAGGGGL